MVISIAWAVAAWMRLKKAKDPRLDGAKERTVGQLELH